MSQSTDAVMPLSETARILLSIILLSSAVSCASTETIVFSRKAFGGDVKIKEIRKTPKYIFFIGGSSARAEINNRAAAFIMEGKFPQAEALLSNMISDFPDCAEAQNNLGVVYESAGMSGKAFTHYAKASLLDSSEQLYRKNINSLEKSTASALIEVSPVKGKTINTFLAMTSDILPGGGHFFTENYRYAGVFSVLKITGGTAAVYLYKDWQKEKRKTTLAGFNQKKSDRAAQKFTFSVLSNAALYGISWMMVFNECGDINRNASPVFEIGGSPSGSGPAVSAGYGFSY